MLFGFSSIGNGVSTAVPVVPPAVVTDGLTHRWLFDEEDGSVLRDSVGDAHLTAYSGVAAALAGTISGPTTTGVAATVFDGATSYCLGGVFLIGADFATEQTLIGKDGLYDEGNEQWIGCARVYAAITTGVLTLEVTTESGVTTIAGPTLTAGKWLEWAVVVSGGVATWYSRQHTAGQAFAGDWVSTTAAAPSSPLLVDGVSELVLGATGTTPDAIWTGSICTAFISPTAPSAANVKLLLARPTKAYAQDVLGANGRLWVADAGTGAIIQEVCQDGWADSITLDGTPTWATNLTGIPQAGLRRGARAGGKPGFVVGTPGGNRLSAYANGQHYIWPDEATGGATRTTPHTVEIVFRFGQGAGTNESYRAKIFGCAFAVSDTGSTRYGRWHQVYNNITTNLLALESVHRISGGSEVINSAAQSDRLFSRGVRTGIGSWDGVASSLKQGMNLHHSLDEVPVMDAAATPQGRYVASGADTGGAWHASAQTWYTFIGNAPLGTVTTHPLLVDMAILEVRVYDKVLSEAEVEQNRAYDKWRNAGVVWYVDEDALFNGVGSAESPLKGQAGLQQAIERAHDGDTILINGVVEIGATNNGAGNILNYSLGAGTNSRIGALGGVTFRGATQDSGIKRVVDTTLAVDGYRTGDVGYGDTDIPDGYAVPHLHNTTTMISWNAAATTPFSDFSFRDMTIDCNELCGHGVNFGNTGGIYGSGASAYNCVFKNSHDWVSEHTAEPFQSGWDDTSFIGNTGINNRSQLCYIATGGVAGDVSDLNCSGNTVTSSNMDTFNHYAASTDTALPDPPAGSLLIGDKGSAVLQSKLEDGSKLIDPIINGNKQIDSGGSFIILYETTGASITNNMRVFDDDTLGYGIRIITDGTGTIANNTIVGGLRGILLGTDDLGADVTLVNNVLDGQGEYNICVEDGDDTTVAATITYCAGNLDEAWNSETGCIGEANISFNADYSLATGSDGKGTAINLYSPYNVLSKNIDGVRRSWNGLWDMGAK